MTTLKQKMDEWRVLVEEAGKTKGLRRSTFNALIKNQTESEDDLRQALKEAVEILDNHARTLHENEDEPCYKFAEDGANWLKKWGFE